MAKKKIKIPAQNERRFPRIKKDGHFVPVSKEVPVNEEGKPIDMRKPRVKKNNAHGAISTEIMNASASRRTLFEKINLMPGEQGPKDADARKVSARKPKKKAKKAVKKKAAKKAAKKAVKKTK